MLSIEDGIRLLDYLATCWNSDKQKSASRYAFISFYGGEPLMNMKFIEAIVNYTKNEFHCPDMKFVYSMTTNAILLHKYMDFLQENKFRLLISLDGNEENMAYRVDKKGNPSFERVVNNINLLQEKYPDYFKKNVNFNAVLYNKNSVESIYNYIKQNYYKIPTIGELNSVGIKANKIKEFNETYQNSDMSLHQSKNYREIEADMMMKSGRFKDLFSYLKLYSGFVFEDYTDLLFERSKGSVFPTGTCVPFSRKMYVTVNGKILPCERIGHQFALGEITENEIKLDLQQISDKMNIYFNKMEKQCNKCENIVACKQCLFNIKGIEEKPICESFMGEGQFKKYVAAQMRLLSEYPEMYETMMTKIISI